MSEKFIIDTNFQTPKPVAEYMMRMAKKYWDQHKEYPGDMAEVLEPTPGEGNLIKAGNDHGFTMYGPGSDQDYWNSWVYQQKPNYFDMVIMNPPFNPHTEMTCFMEDAMNKAPYVVALLPVNSITSHKKLTLFMNYGLASVTMLSRNTFPNKVAVCILELKNGHSGITTFKQFIP